MGGITKKNAWKIAIYLSVVLIILIFSFLGKIENSANNISLEEIKAIGVERMIVSSNEKKPKNSIKIGLEFF